MISVGKVEALGRAAVAAAILACGTAFGKDVPDQQDATTITNTAWKTNVAAFITEVDSIRKRTIIPPEEGWTVGANNGGLLRLGSIYYKDNVPVGVNTGDKGMDGEFGHEVFRRFSESAVEWRGTVSKVISNKATNAYILLVTIPPAPTGADYEYLPVRLDIPVDVIPDKKAPEIGSLIDFKGTLKGQKGESYKKYPVNVVYWFRNVDLAANEPHVHITLSIVDASIAVSPTQPSK